MLFQQSNTKAKFRPTQITANGTAVANISQRWLGKCKTSCEKIAESGLCLSLDDCMRCIE